MIHLPEPIPRSTWVPYQPPSFQQGEVHSLKIPKEGVSENIFAVLKRRRTRRQFGLLSEESLSSLLWSTCKVSRARRESDRAPREQRPLPSAGGCHCTEIVIVRLAGQSPEISLYDAKSHALIEINTVEETALIRQKISEIVAPEDGTIFLFAADYDRVQSCYQDGESLMWRDAGVLMGGLSVVAEAISVNSCTLGFTGQALIATLLGDGRFVGMGGMVFGSRRD